MSRCPVAILLVLSICMFHFLFFCRMSPWCLWWLLSLTSVLFRYTLYSVCSCFIVKVTLVAFVVLNFIAHFSDHFCMLIRILWSSTTTASGFLYFMKIIVLSAYTCSLMFVTVSFLVASVNKSSMYRRNIAVCSLGDTGCNFS